MSDFKWAISANGEQYNQGDFDTKEDAIAEGKTFYDGEPFYVGQCIPPSQPESFWNADDWLDHVSQQEGYSGEWAEGWDCSTNEQREELEIAVRMLLSVWLDKYNLRPTFFNIEEEEHITPETDEEKETQDLPHTG